eukprot:gnl/MRDRNA2_/MRDRNA2_56668_c0_seq1.p1 gnl/MRDRNA2_/MRDRNA2_56668_c0~~gnl/MRDRNA2_/MRDRNA2_56668_c0_seq1.p1  ORF type:complete len:478 (+),score=75.13 gnl/MRDRNA2_/MRDRNA2_56668_c0_seq1:117-1550(+)
MFRACLILHTLSLLSLCHSLKLDALDAQPKLATDIVPAIGEAGSHGKTIVRGTTADFQKKVEGNRFASLLAIFAAVRDSIPSPAVVKTSFLWGVGPVLALSFLMVWLGRQLSGVAACVAGSLGCVLGLCTSWIVHGFLQEAILTKPYGTQNQSFPSVAFLVIASRFGTLLCGLVTVKVFQQKPLVPFELGQFKGGGTKAALRASLLPALFGVASSWIQFGTLWFCTFPTLTVFKAAKIVPSMLMGTLIQKKKYPMSECGEALVIAIGLGVFTWFSETNPEMGLFYPSLTGMAMVLACVLFDTFTPVVQQRSFLSLGMNAFQIMFFTSVTSVVFCSGMVLAGGQTMAIFEFLRAHPDALVDVLAMSVVAVTGSVFIYLLSVDHGATLLAGVTTARQCATAVLSSVVFAHHMPPAAIAGAGVVFTFLLLRAIRGQRAPEPESQEPQKAKAPSLGSASTTASGIDEAGDEHSDARSDSSD